MVAGLRVLIDATAIPADRGGVGRYVDSLVAALDAEGAKLAVVCQPRDTALYTQLAPQSTVLAAAHSISTRTARLTWEQASLPRIAHRLGAQVVHSPHYTFPLPIAVSSKTARFSQKWIPALGSAASVVTLHDATFFTDSTLHSPVKSRFFRTWTIAALRRASFCVAPSFATSRELTRIVPRAGQRIVVIPHGVEPERFHPPSAREVELARAATGVGNTPYIAFLGALEPRKNVPALIEGFARAMATRSDPPALVLAGQPGWDRQIEKALAAVPHRLRVIRAGYLPFETLAGFLGGAEFVAYPSLGEGFGLPVLEAMACQAPVLTTRELSLPEVGADAVAYAGSTAEEIAIALGELLDDRPRRAELAFAALRRSKEFSWAASAQAHHEVYQRAYAAMKGKSGANLG